MESWTRETKAYQLLVHRGVRRCIPDIYFKGTRSISEWDGLQSSGNRFEKGAVLHGIVMEYFEEYKHIAMDKCDLRTARLLGESLGMIHAAGVIHNGIRENNILLVKEEGMIRVVWINFSESWSGFIYLESRATEWDVFRDFLLTSMVPFPLVILDGNNGRIKKS
jgi:hypothetical protein